ncbi:MAG: hypothetical protein ACE5QV_04495, partial [Fidelibacterota bacterium]
SLFITTTSFYLFERELGMERGNSLYAAVSISVSAGLFKEAWDYISKRGTPGVLDILADLGGISIALVIINNSR